MNTRILPILVATAAAAPIAQAWDASGHQVVAQIAYDNCKPTTRQKVKALLDSAVFKTTIKGQKLTLNYRNPATAARFADDILIPTIYGRNPYETPEFAAYHYANLQWTETQSWPPHLPKNTVYQGIEHAKSKLRGLPSPIYKTKTEALLFLLHFVGDVHQPLHVADNHDKGGKTPMLTWEKEIVPHKWWDAAITNEDWDPAPAKTAHLKPAQAKNSATKQTATLKLIRTAATRLASDHNPTTTPYSPTNLDTYQWMRESFDYGAAHIYPAPQPIPKETLLAWQKEALLRATTAGLRLANLLDKLEPDL